MKIRHIIPKGDLAGEHRRLVIQQIAELPNDQPWIIQVEKYSKRRTLQQNAFLHAVPLRMLADETGHDVEDLKTYLLGECFGWEAYEMFGERRKRPTLSSSQLSVEQFAHFLDWIEAWAVENLGMIIPKPNEYIL
jgi:hypothetical protein